MHNMMLYGATVWAIMQLLKYKKQFQHVQRNVLLRMASAFRTVSRIALQVVTGTVTIYLVVQEWRYLHKSKYED